MSIVVLTRIRSMASAVVMAAAFLTAVTLALVVLLGFPGAAEAKDWRIENMDVVLDVQEKGDVAVEETVTFAFEGPFTFVGRVIPTGNLEGIDDIKVFQDGGELPRGDAAGTYNTFYEGSDLVIQVNFALQDTSATWTFKYLAKGAIHFFDEGDELRWYVFDADTPVPIDHASATVRLPAAIAMEQMTTAIDTGFATSDAVTSPEPGVLFYEGSDFAPYTRFWLVAGFPKDVVKFTWTARRVAAYVLPRFGFMLPIFTFLGMLLIWVRRGRDDPAAVYASFMTEPPSGLPPAVAGALIDEKVEVKEILATIVDLGRRGYLEMTDSSEGFWLFKTTNTTFKRLKPIGELKGFEHEVAKAVFDKGKDEVDSSDLKNEFYQNVEPITKKIYEEVTTLGYFPRNPKSTRTRWSVIGVLVLVAWIGLSVLLATAGVPGFGWLLAGGIISGFTVLGFSRFMPQRTSAGAAEQRKWEAFRNYLKDLSRYQDMQTARDTFEKYLPYAIAFGVERSWVRRFEDMQLPAPIWYRPLVIGQNQPGPVWADTGGVNTGLPTGIPGGGVPSLDSISDSLFSSLNSMSSVLTSSPSGSGSSSGGFGGGFGGGFSGGGGGGGFRAG